MNNKLSLKSKGCRNFEFFDFHVTHTVIIYNQSELYCVVKLYVLIV